MSRFAHIREPRKSIAPALAIAALALVVILLAGCSDGPLPAAHNIVAPPPILHGIKAPTIQGLEVLGVGEDGCWEGRPNTGACNEGHPAQMSIFVNGKQWAPGWETGNNGYVCVDTLAVGINYVTGQVRCMGTPRAYSAVDTVVITVIN